MYIHISFLGHSLYVRVPILPLDCKPSQGQGLLPPTSPGESEKIGNQRKEI